MGFAAAGVSALIIFALRWFGKWDRPAAWMLTLALVAASAVLLFRVFPVIMPAVLVLETPALLHVLLKPAAKGREPTDFFASVRSSLLVPAVGVLAVWIWFIASRFSELEKWTDWTHEFRTRVQDDQVSWKIAFVEWVLPLGISGELFLIALLYHLQHRLACRHEEVTEETGQGDVSVNDKYVVSQVKLIGFLVGVTAMGLWIGASIEATGVEQDVGGKADMRNEVMGLCFWVFAILTAWMVTNLGPEKVKQAATNSKAAERVLELVQGEWARAGYLLCFAPFLLIYAALVRLFPGPGDEADLSKQPQRAVAVGQVVVLGKPFLTNLWTTPVVTKAMLLAMLYVSGCVGVKAITLSLAYTNDILKSLDVYVVSAALFAIGTFLFLLPPTPGPPVYALVGILVTVSATNADWSPFWALTWAIGVGFAIKMVFAAVAQKFIGEPMAESVAIRNLVQMHTAEIRAIAMVLQEPGISAAKVSILIGGPDWPVAVLCGMLKLRLCPIMLGLSPVLFQSVIPCVLSGALIVLFGGDESKKALGETALAIAGGLQLVALLVAGYYIQDTLERHYDELTKVRPEDKEALEAEAQAAEAAKHFQERTHFNGLPICVKFVLVLGLTCGFLSCVVLAGPWKALLGMTAFKKFEVTSDLDKVLDGNPLSIIQTLGWVSIGLSAIDALCWQTFSCWAGQAVGDYQKVPGTSPASSELGQTSTLLVAAQ